ncbi:unnamed protein product [Aureobasidium uvarum]|uniref:Major facilitator superfamily (MFS) profile domain-containing protein n=1 Tax=Aureobasidium uvarum TaxID=2773716 RepID=A0A9N8KS77_9PEZI|nr:unnamed protein product [Aureobasidium uvarum]
MADTRNLSVSAGNDAPRTASITPQDMHHLAKVDTNVAAEAARATQSEVSMTLWQAIKTYPKAIGWSVLISTCFDIVLINSLMALPAFQLRFGQRSADGSYQISAAWQSGLSNGALVGEVLGLLFIGYIVERIGYKKTMIGSLTLLTGFIFIVFFAQSLPMLLVGEILMGIPWGAFQTLTTTYAAEVCPVSLRAYLTTYVNLCWVIGQFLSSAVLKGVANKTGPIGYKLPYGLQWIWPVPLIIGIALAPESPWWLVRKNRPEEAKKQVLRLTSRNQTDSGFSVDETVNMMIYTNELEKASTEGTSYLDCFKGIDLRRTEIVCVVWAIQTMCGASSFTGYSTYFFEQAGLDVSSAFSMSLGQYGLGAVGTLLSWVLMTKFGRRTLYLWGQIAMVAILLIVGFLGVAPKNAEGPSWAIGAMILIYTFVYDMTTVVLARNLYNITGVVANVLTPHMLNPDAWGWGAKAGFFWAGTGALCAVWTYFRVPEPKGRTYAEMDMLFDAEISARKFSQTNVESFEDTVMHEKGGEKSTVEYIDKADA